MVIVLGMCFSCTKENGIYEKNATVIWKGSIALDGCGFWVEINGKEYKPTNEDIIDDFYKSEVLKRIRVEVEYKLLEKNAEVYCGLSTTPINTGKIEIISIKKK